MVECVSPELRERNSCSYVYRAEHTT